MRVAFMTEMGFVGKVPRNHPNMRTEFAWMCALEADHYPLATAGRYFEKIDDYDVVIIIVPKKNGNFQQISSLVSHIKDRGCKAALMQEGPHWYWQDYGLRDQALFYNLMMSADIIYAHNFHDAEYYQGLLGKSDVRVMPTLMIEDAIPKMENVERTGTIIGGNFVSWYGGFDSYIVALESNEEIFAPSMGRKQNGEETYVTHLPYYQWNEWMVALNKFKYGVHLMRTYAAGTFALNCAYLGIPCIGYENLDTQRLCHSNLTVIEGDLKTAKALMRRLEKDEKFYKEQSLHAREQYQHYYNEKEFLKYFNDKYEDQPNTTSKK